MQALSHRLLSVSIYQYLKSLFLYVSADAFWLRLIPFAPRAREIIQPYSILFHQRSQSWFASVRFLNPYESSILLARHFSKP